MPISLYMNWIAHLKVRQMSAKCENLTSNNFRIKCNTSRSIYEGQMVNSKDNDIKIIKIIKKLIDL